MAVSHEKRIRELVDRESGRLRRITEGEASRKPSPDKWSLKESLGHLVDSAGNNHQRFVRAQLAGALAFPGYAQTDWVKAQDYAGEAWENLVELWCAYNRHLAHVVGRMTEGARAVECRIGENPPVSLEALVADYIRHVEHHLERMPGGAAYSSSGVSR